MNVSNRSSELETVFQGSHVIGVREFDHMQVVDLFHVLDPLVGLTLRVNHQWPSLSVAEVQKFNCFHIFSVFLHMILSAVKIQININE